MKAKVAAQFRLLGAHLGWRKKGGRPIEPIHHHHHRLLALLLQIPPPHTNDAHPPHIRTVNMALQQLVVQLRRQGGAWVRDMRVIVPATLSLLRPAAVISESLRLPSQQQPTYPLGLAWQGMPPLEHGQDDDETQLDERREGEAGSEGFWDGLLRMAVPKKKVSHRRQRRKLVHYDCENIVHAYPCPACGKPKLRHRLCDEYEKCAAQMPAKYQRSPDAGQVPAAAAAVVGEGHNA